MSWERNAWPAQEPPPDFADRVATAIVIERMAWQRAHRTSSRPRGRWLAAAAVAVSMAAGAAWGLARLTHPVVHPTAAAPAPSPEMAVAPAPPTAVRADPAMPQPEPIARTPKPKRRPEPAAGTTAGDAGAPPKVILPRCNCAQAEGVCGCLE
jgi:hypothetical protein